MPRPIATYLQEFTWITTKISKKQHVRKFSSSLVKLCVKLKIYPQPERIKNRVRTGKVKYEVFSETKMHRPIISYLLHILLIAAEVHRKRFIVY